MSQIDHRLLAVMAELRDHMSAVQGLSVALHKRHIDLPQDEADTFTTHELLAGMSVRLTKIRQQINEASDLCKPEITTVSDKIKWTSELAAIKRRLESA